jgi:putative endonuclease
MDSHVNGMVSYTKSRLPIAVIVKIEFADRKKAFDFESYLKSGSGKAFSKRHFL